MRRRLPSPRPEERAVGLRMREVRKERRMSQRSVAHQFELSRGQLNRIERGTVAVRFFPAWGFCQLTNTNPLWLAFGGDPNDQGCFVPEPTNHVSYDFSFFDVMNLCADAYRTQRNLYLSYLFGGGKTFTPERLVPLYSRRVSGSEDGKSFPKELAFVSEYDDKSAMPDINDPSDLIAQVHDFTKARGAKTSLARDVLKVSRQRLNEWLSGRSKPSAGYAIQLHNWTVKQKKQKKRAGSASTPPALKTRKSKSKSHEKAKSDQKKR